jgi:uncharacterized membrane protein
VGTRRAYLDWLRGLAVIVMIEAHTIDAWTRAADRNTALFGDLRILGGFAAPLFLWLAGLGVVMAASRRAFHSGNRTSALEAGCRRGLEIFVLAFLFRLQAFVVSPGGHPISIFRVDVLNVMGPAMVAAVLIWFLIPRALWLVVSYSVLAALVSMTTPLVRAASWVGTLPVWVQWYVRPTGEYTTFTLFPWAGFVFAGAAAGVLLASPLGRAADNRFRGAWMTGGVALVALGWYLAASGPSVYSVPVSFWTSSPTWFAIRVGILMIALVVMSLIPERHEATASRKPDSVLRAAMLSWQKPLATLGRASLFVYWIHVELVYGYASWFWRQRLPVWGSVLAWLAFSACMYQVVLIRDRFLAGRAARFPPRQRVAGVESVA